MQRLGRVLSGVSERRRGWSVGRGVYSSRTGGGIVWGRSPCTSRPLDGWDRGKYSSFTDTLAGGTKEIPNIA